MSWVCDPLTLVTTLPRWPLDASLSKDEAQDALAQWLVAAGVALAIYRKTLLPVAAVLGILLVNYLLWDIHKKQFLEAPSYTMSQANRDVIGRNTIQPHALQEAGCARSNAASSAPLKPDTAVNGVLPWSAQSRQYPNNPGKFDQGQAVRGRVASGDPRVEKLGIRVAPNQSLARMFQSPETRGVDASITPLPDPTLMARQPHCPKSTFDKSNDFMDHGKLGYLY